MLRALQLLVFTVALADPAGAEAQFRIRQEHGVVVAAIDGILLVSDSHGSENVHVIGPNVFVVINGIAAHLDDLQRGDAITISTDDEDNVLTIVCQRPRMAVNRYPRLAGFW